MRVLLLLLLLLTSSGCVAPRVALPQQPTADAPVAEREAWLREQLPLDHVGGRALVLQSGRQVRDLHELLPFVDKDSATARAVEAADDAALTSGVVGALGVLGLSAGLITMLAGPFVVIDSGGSDDVALTVLGAGTLLAMAGGSATILIDEYAAEAEAQRTAAMITYGGDARRRLRLADGAQPPPAPLPTPAPVAPETNGAE